MLKGNKQKEETMKASALIEKMVEILGNITSLTRVLTVTQRPHVVPVPVVSQYPTDIGAKARGEWYLHTILGR